MGNKRILFQKNNFYHVYNRGLNKQILFKNDQDFEKFYKYIIKNYKDYNDKLKIVAYSFLPNHFHFVFQIHETGLELSHFMRKIQVSYAMYFKRKYETGLIFHIFEGRFKAKLIDNEKYLYKCLAYVNLNALKHKIVDNIDQYKWTSYHSLADKDKIEEYKDYIVEELEF